MPPVVVAAWAVSLLPLPPKKAPKKMMGGGMAKGYKYGGMAKKAVPATKDF